MLKNWWVFIFYKWKWTKLLDRLIFWNAKNKSNFRDRIFITSFLIQHDTGIDTIQFITNSILNCWIFIFLKYQKTRFLLFFDNFYSFCPSYFRVFSIFQQFSISRNKLNYQTLINRTVGWNCLVKACLSWKGLRDDFNTFIFSCSKSFGNKAFLNPY